MSSRSRVAAVLVLGAVCGCGIAAQEQARPLPVGVVQTPDAAVAVPGDTGRSVEQLFFIDDEVLRSIDRRVPVATPAVALRDLLAGPTLAEADLGLSSALPVGLDAQVRQDGAVAVVSLGAALAGTGRSDAVLALAQVVATLSAAPSVSFVRFEQDGKPLPVPRSDGSLTSRPLTVSDYADLLPVTLASPSPTR